MDHEHISLDGKRLRGSGDEHAGNAMLHMVNAWASGAGISLGQATVDRKQNEHKAMLRILDVLDLCGYLMRTSAASEKTMRAKILQSYADWLSISAITTRRQG